MQCGRLGPSGARRGPCARRALLRPAHTDVSIHRPDDGHEKAIRCLAHHRDRFFRHDAGGLPRLASGDHPQSPDRPPRRREAPPSTTGHLRRRGRRGPGNSSRPRGESREHRRCSLQQHPEPFVSWQGPGGLPAHSRRDHRQLPGVPGAEGPVQQRRNPQAHQQRRNAAANRPGSEAERVRCFPQESRRRTWRTTPLVGPQQGRIGVWS